MASTIHLDTDTNLGESVVVREDRLTLIERLDTAREQDQTTIEATLGRGRSISFRIERIVAVEQR